MAKSRSPRARTATGKKATPVTRAQAEPASRDALIDQDIRDRPALTEDEQLLQSPTGDMSAYTRSDPWRVMRITAELGEGFDAPAGIRKGVTIFRSARIGPDESH